MSRDLPYEPCLGGADLITLTAHGGTSLWWGVDDDYQGLAAARQRGLRPRPSWPTRIVRRAALPAVERAAAVLAPRHADAPRDAILCAVHDRHWQHVDGAMRDVLLDSVWRHLDGPIVSTAPWTGPGVPWPAGGGRGVARARDRLGPARHVALEAFWTPAAAREERRVRRRLSAMWARARPALARRAQPGVLARLDEYVDALMPRYAALLHMARRAIDSLAPRVLLVSNEYGKWERALVVAAHQAGVPSVGLQHGIIHADHPGYRLPAAARRQGDLARPMPDTMAVFGPAYRDLLEPIIPGRTQITGHPATDRLATMQDDRPAWQARLGLPAPVLLWISQPLPPGEWRATRNAILAAARAVGATPVLKLHPLEPVPSAPGMAVQGAEADTYALITAADVIVTKDSTAAVEAMAAGRPVIVLNLTGAHVVDYVARQAAYGAHDAVTLEAGVRQALEAPPPGAAAYARDMLGPLDGMAGARVARLL